MAVQIARRQTAPGDGGTMGFVQRILQGVIIRFARPIILQDMAGSAKLRQALVEGDRRNPLWRKSRERVSRSTFHPYLMRLNLRNAVDRAAFFLGRWDQHETQLFMRDVLYSSDVVIDIGANRGMFTLCASHCVGLSGLVVSFEPDQASRKLLEREISINNIRNVSVRPYGAALREDKQDLNGEKIRFVRGDDHIRNLSPAMIRIACKGQAHEALAGLTRTIKAGYPAILVDLDEQSERQAIMRTLQDLGYSGESLAVVGKGREAKWAVRPMRADASSFTSLWTHPATHQASRRIIDNHRI
jgi:hypothetical protein